MSTLKLFLSRTHPSAQKSHTLLFCIQHFCVAKLIVILNRHSKRVWKTPLAASPSLIDYSFVMTPSAAADRTNNTNHCQNSDGNFCKSRQKPVCLYSRASFSAPEKINDRFQETAFGRILPFVICQCRTKWRLLHGGKKSPKLMAIIEPFLVGPARHCVREVVWFMVFFHLLFKCVS